MPHECKICKQIVEHNVGKFSTKRIVKYCHNCNMNFIFERDNFNILYLLGIEICIDQASGIIPINEWNGDR